MHLRVAASRPPARRPPSNHCVRTRSNSAGDVLPRRVAVVAVTAKEGRSLASRRRLHGTPRAPACPAALTLQALPCVRPGPASPRAACARSAGAARPCQGDFSDKSKHGVVWFGRSARRGSGEAAAGREGRPGRSPLTGTPRQARRRRPFSARQPSKTDRRRPGRRPGSGPGGAGPELDQTPAPAPHPRRPRARLAQWISLAAALHLYRRVSHPGACGVFLEIKILEIPTS